AVRRGRAIRPRRRHDPGDRGGADEAVRRQPEETARVADAGRRARERRAIRGRRSDASDATGRAAATSSGTADLPLRPDGARDLGRDREALQGPVELTSQSAFRPANFTTLAHFSMSSAISLPSAAGGPGGSTMPPRSAMRALIFASEMAALISLLRIATTSAGRVSSAPQPDHRP